MKIFQPWKHLTHTHCESYGDSLFLSVAHIRPWEYIASQTPNLLMSDRFFYSLRLAWGWLVIYFWHCMWAGEWAGLLVAPCKGLLSSTFLLSSDASSIIISWVSFFVSWWDPNCQWVARSISNFTCGNLYWVKLFLLLTNKHLCSVKCFTLHKIHIVMNCTWNSGFWSLSFINCSNYCFLPCWNIVVNRTCSFINYYLLHLLHFQLLLNLWFLKSLL